MCHNTTCLKVSKCSVFLILFKSVNFSTWEAKLFKIWPHLHFPNLSHCLSQNRCFCSLCQAQLYHLPSFLLFPLLGILPQLHLCRLNEPHFPMKPLPISALIFLSPQLPGNPVILRTKLHPSSGELPISLSCGTNFIHMSGDPLKNSYLLEGRSLVIQASQAKWVFYECICISVPAGIVVRGCIQLQWISFEDSFNAWAHFMMDDLRGHLPTLRWVFSFWPKQHDPCAPPSLFT